MRKIYTFLLLFVTSISFAQLDLKLNLLNSVTEKPEIGIEIGANNFSVELDNGLILKKWGELTITDDNINDKSIRTKRFGYNGSLRANYYFDPVESLDGWYVSPIVKYRSQKIKFNDPIKNKRVGAALVFGRKGLIFERIGYSTELGFGYWFVNSYKNSKGKTDPIYRDFFNGLLEKFDKIILPFTVTAYYRFGN